MNNSELVMATDDEIQVGKNQLKNGWILTMSQYGGSYNIDKAGVYGIWANRTTGGQWGDGMWTIRLLDGVGIDKTHINVVGGFDIESCNSVVDEMEALIIKYNIEDYKYKEKKKKTTTTTTSFGGILKAVKSHFKTTLKNGVGEIMNNSELWVLAEEGKIQQWSVFIDEQGFKIIWTGKSFQDYTGSIDKYIGMCKGDNWTFVGVEEMENEQQQ